MGENFFNCDEFYCNSCTLNVKIKGDYLCVVMAVLLRSLNIVNNGRY